MPDDSDDTNGALVQLVAHRIVNAKVTGSSPVRSAI